MYDSLSDEVIEDEPKEKNIKKDENKKENEKDKDKDKGKDKEKDKRPESNNVRYLLQLKKEKELEKKNKVKEIKEKQKEKYSKYQKIVIQSVDKGSNEKKMGEIYTTYKPPQQKRPMSKDKKPTGKSLHNNINNNDKKRSQSTGFKNHAYKKDTYDDELTKQFMSPNPNNYNGFMNEKDKDNNYMLSPTVEIENLINKKNQYDQKVKDIKNFLKM